MCSPKNMPIAPDKKIRTGSQKGTFYSFPVTGL